VEKNFERLNRICLLHFQDCDLQVLFFSLLERHPMAAFAFGSREE